MLAKPRKRESWKMLCSKKSETLQKNAEAQDMTTVNNNKDGIAKCNIVIMDKAVRLTAK